MDILSKLDDIENFGINLKLESEEAEFFYCDAIREWFSLKDEYETYIINEREFGVEMNYESVASIYIYESVLRIRPMDNMPYDLLLDVLEFVATKHSQTVRVWEYINDNEEALVGKILETEQYEEEVEEESSSDEEWI